MEGPAAGGLLVHKGSDGGLDEGSREVIGIDWRSTESADRLVMSFFGSTLNWTEQENKEGVISGFSRSSRHC